MQVSGSNRRRLLVVQVAGLGHDLACARLGGAIAGLAWHPLESVFPALTCPVQATFRTAAPPGTHGMAGNGVYHRGLRRPFFWEQSAALVAGRRIWETFRAGGGTVGLFFWQQSLGENVDFILSPAPIHRHHGGMVDACYSRPAGLYPELCRRLGRPFCLRHYWGPLASTKSSAWIAEATAAALCDAATAPDLCLTYLPGLDYDLQRFGPDHPRSAAALEETIGQLGRLVAAGRERGYEVLVFGDYAIGAVTRPPATPNRALREAGLFQVREVSGMCYPDLFASRAFAVADHEIAHVYVPDGRDVDAVADALRGVAGVGEVLDRDAQAARGLAHAQSGELVLVAAAGSWFAYPWWAAGEREPDYARHVDIHNKPGYDPCELFFGWPPGSVSRNASRVRGSHGRIGPGREACWASTFLPPGGATLLDVAVRTGEWLLSKVLWQAPIKTGNE